MVKYLGGAVDDRVRGNQCEDRPAGDRADCGEAGEWRGGGSFVHLVLWFLFLQPFSTLPLLLCPVSFDPDLCSYCDRMAI